MKGAEEAVDRVSGRAGRFLQSFRSVLIPYFILKIILSVLCALLVLGSDFGFLFGSLVLFNLMPFLLFEAPALYILYRGKYHRPQMLIRMTRRQERFMRYGARLFLLLWVLGLLTFAMSSIHPTYDNAEIVMLAVFVLFFLPLWIFAFVLAWMTHRSKRMEAEKPGNFRVPLGREETER